MNKTKTARRLLLLSLLGLAVSALAAYLNVIHFNSTNPTIPSIPVLPETTNPPITNSVSVPESRQATFPAAENRSVANIQSLAKKYGTTDEERKAYVEKAKEKQANKTTHDQAVADFRESLRAMHGSSDAVLRAPW